jgi:hypothetical protein
MGADADQATDIRKSFPSFSLKTQLFFDETR